MSARVVRRFGFGIGILLSVAASVAVLVWRPYMLSDWVKLYGYTPPAEITSIADATAMTNQARHVFYVNRPSLEDKAAFRKNCPRADEKTIVIGCYRSGQGGIHILTVDDSRLEGVEQVTAAHEMLHAAYERLGGSEKKRVDALLRSYQQSGLQDQRILSAIESYKKSEPGQELNEIHSMFGTEIADLPDELEAYYSRYFTSRKTVVALADRYQDAFTSREVKLAEYDTQLKDYDAQIQANTTTLDMRGADIERERVRLDGLLRERAVDEYNASVEPFNKMVAGYNALLETTKSMIDEYNTIVEKRNAIAAQSLELQQAIDSSNLPTSR